MDSVRIDRWLCAARIYRSRTEATGACADGRVTINGATVRPSRLVRVGDRITANAPRGPVILDVLGLADRRLGPAPARDLYADHSPPPPPREERFAIRTRGQGRPTKRDRRDVDKLRVE
jgi:ribosome-associated heat shock protein Hsp15